MIAKRVPAGRKRVLKAVLAYEGTRFNGWQVQNKGQRTVQAEMERAVEKVTGRHVRVTGASRTDAGVHAEAQVAHFECRSKLPAPVLKRALNHYLPREIAVRSLKDVCKVFHARYGAKGKLYRYRIYASAEKPVFETALRSWVTYPLDLAKMRRAAKCLIGRHDFSAFCTSANAPANPVRTLRWLSLKREGGEIRIEARANSFLNHMVRIIVGTLVDVGCGRIRPDRMKAILESKDRRRAGRTAEARGLTLVKVNY